LRPPNSSGSLGVRCAELTRSRDEGSCRLLEEPLGARGPGGKTIGNERPTSAAADDQSLGFERAVRLRDRVRRELEILGERSDGGQAATGRDRASVDPFGDRP
jgi:hypothetical protein